MAPIWTPVPHTQPESRWVVDISRPFSEGGFGIVYRGRDKGETGEEAPKDCAAKKLGLATQQEIENFQKERAMLQRVGGHESIIELYGSVEAPEAATGWLFLEMATGGELFDRLTDSGRLSERAAWPFVSRLAKAVAHMFSRGLVHRDLKLENIMLHAADPNAVKVIDFGLAMELEIGEDGLVIERAVADAAGTAAYRAPEVYHQPSYSPLKLDVWAMGIVTFSLVSGFFPVEEAKDTDRRFRKLAADQREGIGVCESTFKTYKQQHLHTFSPALKSLIDGMLTIDYTTRLSVKEVEGHPWITNEPAGTIDAAYEGDQPVYRGVSGGGDELLEDFQIPEDAVPLSRQKAERLVVNMELR